MASITEQRNELSMKKVKELEEIFYKAGIEFYRTGSNFNTLTYECGEMDGKPVYGSIKFTLHKDDYDLDNKIEEFEMFFEERKQKAKEKERKKASLEKKEAIKKSKAAERKTIEEREKERRREYLASLKENESSGQ